MQEGGGKGCTNTLISCSFPFLSSHTPRTPSFLCFSYPHTHPRPLTLINTTTTTSCHFTSLKALGLNFNFLVQPTLGHTTNQILHHPPPRLSFHSYDHLPTILVAPPPCNKKKTYVSRLGGEYTSEIEPSIGNSLYYPLTLLPTCVAVPYLILPLRAFNPVE